jgi:hypothetical protein
MTFEWTPLPWCGCPACRRGRGETPDEVNITAAVAYYPATEYPEAPPLDIPTLCGTLIGYRDHLDKGTDPCAACRAAEEADLYDYYREGRKAW